MDNYLDDRMYVLCLGKFIDENLLSKEDRIISQNFQNIENFSFYTENGIVKNGEHSINILYQLDEEGFNIFENQTLDDMLGFLPIKSINKYAVLTFKNIKGYPPYKQTIFDSLDQALEYIRETIAFIPLVGLDHKPQKFASIDEYKRFIDKYDMLEYFDERLLENRE